MTTQLDQSQKRFSSFKKQLSNKGDEAKIDNSWLLLQSSDTAQQGSKKANSYLIQGLEEMIDRHVASISAKDISDADLPVDYVIIVALVFMVGFGIYVFTSVNKQRSALPLSGKRRID